MGNSESNERKPNYKIYKITLVNRNENYTRCFLNDYVPYKDGNYKHMDFKRDKTLEFLNFGATLFGTNPSPLPILKVGWYIRVDTNYTRENFNYHNFGEQAVSNVVVRDSDGSFLRNTAELLSEIQGSRERYQVAIEQSQASNYARLRQTSYDVPPKK